MKVFSGLSQTARTMIACLGVLFLVLLAAGLAVSLLIYPFERPLPYCLGLLLGCGLSAGKVVLLERSLSASLDMESKNAKNYAGLQAILRYFLTIVVLLLAVFFRNVVGIWGIVVGILSLQLAAYLSAFLLRKKRLN